MNNIDFIWCITIDGYGLEWTSMGNYWITISAYGAWSPPQWVLDCLAMADLCGGDGSVNCMGVKVSRAHSVYFIENI